MKKEVRDVIARRIGWALAGFEIPEVYHGDLKADPLYVPGEPIGIVDYLPSIKGVDPAGHLLFDQLVEAAVAGLEDALREMDLHIVLK